MAVVEDEPINTVGLAGLTVIMASRAASLGTMPEVVPLLATD